MEYIGRLKEKGVMLRLGLCCQFKEAPIKFRTTTVGYLKRLSKEKGLAYLSGIIEHNSESLIHAVEYCINNGIHAFRVNSQLFPIFTHEELGYRIEELAAANQIRDNMEKVRVAAAKGCIRLSFHPDQFVVLSSPKEEIVKRSIKELEYHALMADWIGADVINIHGGGGYDDKEAALNRFKSSFAKLSQSAQEKLTVENDDRVYTPEELLALCKAVEIPLVYDVHHHRCLPDQLTEEQATKLALETWNREPLFHLSSPKEGWQSKNPRLHHDYIDIADFPLCWQKIDPLTVDVEAKAKELAVIELAQQLKQHKAWQQRIGQQQ